MQDDKGNVTYQKDTDVGALGNGKLAIAFDQTDENDKVTAVGQATAESNANVQVQSGLLTLDAVPDFGFANAAEGTTVALDNNEKNGSTATDSQGKGVLTVTDSRKDQPGFTVNASISKFANVNDETDLKPYILNLTPTELKNDKDESVSASATPLLTKTINISGDSDTTESDEDAAQGTVMDLEAGKYNAGAINASFTADDKDAFLNLDAGKPDPAAKDTNSAKSYNATITWTLATKSVVA